MQWQQAAWWPMVTKTNRYCKTMVCITILCLIKFWLLLKPHITYKFHIHSFRKWFLCWACKSDTEGLFVTIGLLFLHWVNFFGSRPSDHYFRSVCLSVCLFVCLFVQSFSQPSLMRFRSNLDICYMSGSSCPLEPHSVAASFTLYWLEFSRTKWLPDFLQWRPNFWDPKSWCPVNWGLLRTLISLYIVYAFTL